MAWKEWREVTRLDDGLRSLAFRFALVASFGILLAWRLGDQFGRGWSTVGVLAELAMLASLPLAPDAFAGERERHTLPSLLASPVTAREVFLGKYLAMLGLAALAVIFGALAGVVLVLVRFGITGLALNGGIIIGGLIVATLAAAVVAGIAVVISVHSPTSRAAAQRCAYALVLLIFLSSALSRRLPAAVRSDTAGWSARVMGLSQPAQIAIVACLLGALALAISAVGLLSFGRQPLS